MRTFAAIIGVALGVTLTAQPRRDSAVAALLDELNTYLALYEPELSSIVAEEELLQEVTQRRTAAQRRLLISDVAFVRLPGDGAWIGYREVKRVDRQPVSRKRRCSSCSRSREPIGRRWRPTRMGKCALQSRRSANY